MEAIPVIETERLILRGHRLEDLGGCITMWSDPAVTRFIGGKPSTEQQTWMRMLGYLGHWSLMKFGYWAIEHRQTASFAGELGFADFKRDLAPSMKSAPELGWVLASQFHGQGLATEAVRAAVAWGDTHFASPRTVCMIDPDNLASIRVARKCGYEVFERASYHDRPALFFSRMAAKGFEAPPFGDKTA
jgi:RimJ/RimL family protein N-acetyltransferase